MPFPAATYDPYTDCAYVRLREGRYDRTSEIDESHFVDYDAQGSVLGIESIAYGDGARLAKIAAGLGVDAHEATQAIQAARAAG